MNITYSPELNRAIAYAQEEARGLGHQYVSTPHLLLGLCRTDSAAGRFLRAMGVSLPFALPVVEKLYGQEQSSDQPLEKNAKLPLDHWALRDLAVAQSESNRLKSILCHPEHLLLALFIDPESLCAAGILPALGLSLTHSEAELAVLADSSYDNKACKQQLEETIARWLMRAEMAREQGRIDLMQQALQHADKYKKLLADLN